MSQHPNASPSPLAGEIAAVIAEVVTAQANTMHAVARLAMLARDLAQDTALTPPDAALFQEIANPTAPAHPAAHTDRADRREIILDLYATTNLTGYAIARRVGVALDTPSKLVRKARAAGDRRAAQGDLLRRDQPADQAAPLRETPSTPHDGLPENGGNASPARPEETGALGKAPAQGEEVVPAPSAGEELTTSDDPAPAPELAIVGVDLGLGPARTGIHDPDRVLVAGTREHRTVIDALRSANERILRPAAEMELADELEDAPPPRRAAPQEPVTKRGPAGLAQRVSARVERPQDPAKPTTKAIPLTEAEVGLPIIHVDRKAKTVVGPLGTWGGCPDIVLAVMTRLADGNLYGQPVLQKLAGFNRPETFASVLKRWKGELQDIGVEMYVGEAGVRLQRQEIV